MSWKLAELRWRHDIGLYESRWEKESGPLPVERKRAIEAFERRGRRSQSLSASGCAAKSNFTVEKDVSLGEPVMPALSAFGSSVEVVTHERPPAQRARSPQLSSSSLFLCCRPNRTAPQTRSLSRGSPWETTLLSADSQRVVTAVLPFPGAPPKSSLHPLTELSILTETPTRLVSNTNSSILNILQGVDR